MLPNRFWPLATPGQQTSLQSWSKTTIRAFLLWEGARKQRMLRAEERWKEAKQPLSFPGPLRKRFRSIKTGGGTTSTLQTFHFKHKVREASISMQTIPQCYRRVPFMLPKIAESHFNPEYEMSYSKQLIIKKDKTAFHSSNCILHRKKPSQCI